ncbi:MAG: hypothetical protein TU36_002510 [Vulcanisaeta sp. AZ3]
MNIIGILFTLTVSMIVIHVAISFMSFRYLTIPRSVGIVIAPYESAYYMLLFLETLVNNYALLLLIIIFVFLVIHVGGTYLYLERRLSNLSINHDYLRYYGYYELVEVLFLIFIAVFLSNS